MKIRLLAAAIILSISAPSFAADADMQVRHHHRHAGGSTRSICTITVRPTSIPAPTCRRIGWCIPSTARLTESMTASTGFAGSLPRITAARTAGATAVISCCDEASSGWLVRRLTRRHGATGPAESRCNWCGPTSGSPASCWPRSVRAPATAPPPAGPPQWLVPRSRESASAAVLFGFIHSGLVSTLARSRRGRAQIARPDPRREIRCRSSGRTGRYCRCRSRIRQGPCRSAIR